MSRRYTVACLAGDGVGPELTAEASRVLAVVSRLHGFGITELHLPFGGEALVRFGHRLPLGTQSDLGRADAVLVAAPGEPAFQLVKAALDPVCSLTRASRHARARHRRRPHVRGHGRRRGDSEAFLLAGARAGSARSATRTAGATSSTRRPPPTGAGSSSAPLVQRSSGGVPAGAEPLETWSPPTRKLNGALGDALAALSGTVDLACRGGCPRHAPGLFAPCGCGRSDRRRLRRRRSRRHAARRFAASGHGSARARRGEDARTGDRRRTDRAGVTARCDDQNVHGRGDRQTAGKPYRCRTR